MRRWSSSLLALVVCLGALTAVTAVQPTRASAAVDGGVFVPVTAKRMFPASGQGSEAVTTAGKTFQVAGLAGVPSTNVSAVVADVTIRATTRSASGYVAVALFPAGGTRPEMAAVVGNSQTVPRSNTTIVKLGTGGKLTVWASDGVGTDVEVDIQGYFTVSGASSESGGFVPVNPKRIVDTPNGRQASTRRLNPWESLTVNSNYNNSGVPSGARAMYVSVISSEPNASSAMTFTRASETWQGKPASFEYGNSSSAGRDVGGFVVPLDADGTFRITNGGGSVHIVVDVQGYFTGDDPTATGGGFSTGTQELVYDTFSGTPAKFTPYETRSIQVTGKAGVPAGGVGAVALTLWGRGATASGHIVAWKSGAAKPNTGNLTFDTGETGTGASIATTAMIEPGSDGRILVRNNTNGTVDLRVAIQGWFATTTPRLHSSIETVGPCEEGCTAEQSFLTSSNAYAVARVADTNAGRSSVQFELRQGDPTELDSLISTASVSVGTTGTARWDIGSLEEDSYSVRTREVLNGAYGEWSPWYTFTTPADSNAYDLADGTYPAGANDESESDAPDADADDPQSVPVDQPLEEYVPVSPQDGQSSLRAVEWLVTRGDDVHYKRAENVVSGHGWWETSKPEWKTARATVTIELQAKMNGKWKTVEKKSRKNLKPGRSRSANAREVCSDTNIGRNWRSRVDVDVQGFVDPAGKLVTNKVLHYCTP